MPEHIDGEAVPEIAAVFDRIDGASMGWAVRQIASAKHVSVSAVAAKV